MRGRAYLICGGCGLMYLDPVLRMSVPAARRRYLSHRNGREDRGYCDFLHRAIDAARPYLSTGSKGLDYGCGPSPTLSGLLTDLGYRMTDYDPLFRDVPLDPPYDFVFSTECFEHFEEPAREIERVVALLAPEGLLTVMSELRREGMDLERWHYLSDPTHVSLYTERTWAHICRVYGLRPVAGDGRRVFVLRKL